ncbi:S8 family serine peptidase [Haladaptatus caseinilyticus]|uniref:S8 family serine peptidase n=1 Tax=Haladaptatus caseinilyticus TaxID=2993314 RepID=UPI00224B5CFA|nr:S8 family serine peptidase [Haladaptatus caseinilyticus]
MIIPTRRQLLGATASYIGSSTIGFTEQRAQASQASQQYIVGTTSPEAVKATNRRATAVSRVLDFEWLGKAIVGKFSPQAIDALRRRSGVCYIERNGTMRAVNHETTAGQTLSWGADRINADHANHKGYSGNGADLAILDTGLDSDHPDLQANIGDGKAFDVACGQFYAGNSCPTNELNGNTCHYSWDDDDDHGSIIGAIAGALDNTTGVVGVAPEVTLHSLKVLDCAGIGDYASIAAAIAYTADQGWDVANMSFAGEPSQIVHDACKYAYKKGVLLVAAAANRGCDGCVRYPAAHPEVIAVSATTRSDTITSISSTGPEVELAAPGEYIQSVASNSYAVVTGTSAATPHVSATAALLMANGQSNANSKVYDTTDTLTIESYTNPGGTREQLRATAEDINLAPNEQGYGLVNAEAAIAIGQRGKITTNQPARSSWQLLTFDSFFADPVAIAGPLSTNGSQPSHIRLREVTNTSFNYQIEEWSYLDGSHTQETFSYVVLAQGAYTTPSGSRMEVGIVPATHAFDRHSFFQSFTEVPIILSNSQTVNETDPIVTRSRNVSNMGFDLRLQEEEAGGQHATETVGYLACEPTVSSINGVSFEVGRTPNAVTDDWYSHSFEQDYQVPLILADLQTSDGGDAAGVRYQNLNNSGVEFKIEEERSRDTESGHTTEEVGYLVFEGQGLI